MGEARTRLSVDERRDQLLELGLDLFIHHTYDELSIDEIARRAGISKGLLYHYFPGKRAFYVATVERAAEQLLAETDIPVAPGDDDSVKLRIAIDRYLGFVEQRSAAYTFLLRGAMATDPDVAAIVERTRRRFLDRMLQALQMSDDNARLRVTLRGVIGFVEAASVDWAERRDLSREELTELLVQVCVSSVTRALASS